MTKHERKLITYLDKADECTSREEAKKIILKADKLHAKLIASMQSNDAS